MSQIYTLVATLEQYQALPHHTNPRLHAIFVAVQAWQKARIHRTHHALFEQAHTQKLANYLLEQIYADSQFAIIAEQLLIAGKNALNGFGRLEKLIPARTLSVGILGVQSAILTIKLDLQLASVIHDNPQFLQEFDQHGISTALITKAYQQTQRAERIAQIHAIKDVCESSYAQFNSFLLQKAFKLAKNTAYQNGYQPLYDFIHDGLVAIRCLDDINAFTTPFVQGELTDLSQFYAQNTPIQPR